MKRYIVIITLALAAILSLASCGNRSGKAKGEETQPVDMADSVLTIIDQFADEYTSYLEAYAEYSETSSPIVITKGDKLVEPDFLLDPQVATTLVTRSQKASCLAILLVERNIREAYGMPLAETDEAVARLALELNQKLDYLTLDDIGMTYSEKISKEYQACKEAGDLAFFWMFTFATCAECEFIISRNPEEYLADVTDKGYSYYYSRLVPCYQAMKEMSSYDPEVASVVTSAQDIWGEGTDIWSIEAAEDSHSTLEAARKAYSEEKEKYAAIRASLLR